MFDNCEHVADACAALTRTLLSHCPGLRVLATSQEPLRIEGENVWRLPPLVESVELFTTRAAANHSAFPLDAAELAFVEEICVRLDGSPLAIELAAARFASLGAREILDRLDDRFPLLTSSRRDLPDRQRSLRAAMTWSYDLLGTEDRSLLDLLGVFVGSFDLAAVEHVAGASIDALDSLGRLVDRSLVGVRSGEGRMRYQLLESVRAFAVERLTESGAEADARECAARWFAASAARIAQDEDPNQYPALELLGRDLDNYRAALAWFVAHDPVAGLQLAVHLCRLWGVSQFNLGEGSRWLSDTLAAATSAPSSLRAEALSGLALLHRLQNRLQSARELASASLAEGDFRPGSALPARVVLGQILSLLGEFEEAERLYNEHLQLCRAAGDRFGQALALREVASAALERGDTDLAATRIEEAASCADGATWLADVILGDRARIALVRGDLALAREIQGEVLRTCNQVPRAIAGSSLGMARVERHFGDLEQARALLGVDGRFLVDNDDLLGVAHVLVELGLGSAQALDWRAAASALALAERIRQDAGAATPGSEADGISAAIEGARSALGAADVDRLFNHQVGDIVDAIRRLIESLQTP